MNTEYPGDRKHYRVYKRKDLNNQEKQNSYEIHATIKGYKAFLAIAIVALFKGFFWGYLCRSKQK